MIKHYPLIILAVFLTACKTNVETTVKLSDLLEAETKALQGDMYLEVTNCRDYEDSRKPSDAVIEAKKTIPGVFPDAEYVECFRKQFDSYAHFTLPVMLDKDKDDQLASNTHINIYSNDSTLLGVGIPESIQKRIEQVEEDNFGATSFDLNVTIDVVNDLGEAFDFSVISAYVNDYPYVFGELTAQADGGAFTVTLSDVSVQSALQNRLATVLLHNNN